MSELGAASWRQRRQILRARPQPEEPKRSNHKNTKKWCKGVKGREHNYIWTPDLRHSYGDKALWSKHECTKCQKQDNYCFFWDAENSFKLDRPCKCGFHKKKEIK
jgi:hypothetical protein